MAIIHETVVGSIFEFQYLRFLSLELQEIEGLVQRQI